MMRVEPGNYLLSVGPQGQQGIRRLPERFSINTGEEPQSGGDTITIGKAAKAGAKVSGFLGALSIIGTGLAFGFKLLSPTAVVGSLIGSMVSGAIFGAGVGWLLKRGQQHQQ